MPDGSTDVSRHSSSHDDKVDTKGASTPDELPKVNLHDTDLGVIENNIDHAIATHALNDPNLDPVLIETAQGALEKHDKKAELILEDVLEEDSIYPEVRAAVTNIDDPTMPVNTFRAWFLGLIAVFLISGINQFFIFQSPLIQITGLVAQLVAFPLGKALEKLPYKAEWPLGWFFNPGPFNIKEHTLITVMATVAYGQAYATDILATQKVYYHQDIPAGYQILLTLSTQLIGFSYAGFIRQWTVWPAAMIWPSNLPNCALMNTLHNAQGVAEGMTWSRNRMFLTVFVAIFCWEWVPNYLFMALTYFSWPAWIAPNNYGVNMVFGGEGGIGLNMITLDWSTLGYLGSPLWYPWFSIANITVGFMISVCFVSPILNSLNYLNGGYIPFSSGLSYDRFGNPFNSTHVLGADGRLDQAALDTYSLPYLPTSFMVSYAWGFGAITAALVHVGLFYGKDIVHQLKRSVKDEPDIHARLMSRYPEVPVWWYLAIFLVSFGMAVPAVYCYETSLPVWALILALIIAAVYTLPLSIITAVTGSTIGLNVITEMIVGYMLPGRPAAMMIFKCFGYITMAQAVSFLSDLKFGHYMKVPPRTMFAGQVVAQIIAVFVQLGVMAWIFKNVTGLCTADAHPVRFTCSYTRTFYTASVLWGLVGPRYTFGGTGLYRWTNIMFLFGAIMPIPTYFLARRYRFFRYVNFPIIFSGPGYFPPASALSYTAWFSVGWFFQYYLRRNKNAWWASYNFVVSAALDSGTAIAIIIITLALEYPNAPALNNVFGGDSPWWGNTIEGTTRQGQGLTLYQTVPPNGFAPAPNGQYLPSPFDSSA